MPRVAAFLIVFVASNAGCSFLGITVGSSADRAEASGGPGQAYNGPECAGVDIDKRNLHRPPAKGGDKRDNWREVAVAPQPKLDSSVPDQVAAVVCGEEMSGRASGRGPGIVATTHARFDDRNFDHYAAALILTSCSKMHGCLQGPKSESRSYIAGLLAFYAKHVDSKQVQSRLRKAGVAAGPAKRFVEQLAIAKETVGAIVAKLAPVQKQVYVEIPEQTRVEVEAHYREYNDEWSRLEKLARAAERERSSGVTPQTVAGLEGLRADYVKKCGGAKCMHDGLAAAVARQLFFAHVSRQDATGATAEAKFVTATGDRGRSAALLIDARQGAAMKAATEAKRKYDRARDQGLDDATAKTTVGSVPPYDFGRVDRLRFDKLPEPRWVELVPGDKRPHEVRGKVRSKRTKGERTTIIFADDVRKWADEACRDTRKIDRIDRHGRIEYKQRCRKTGKINVDRRKTDPVTVPTSEAKPLKTGDEVTVFAISGDPKTGHVWIARRNKQLVQLRGVRVKPSKD